MDSTPERAGRPLCAAHKTSAGAEGPTGSGGRFDPANLFAGHGLVLEVDLVDLRERHLGGGDVLLGVDGVHRAGVDAGPAVDALVGIDEDHAVLVHLVDAVHGTDLDAGLVLEIDAGLGDDIGHDPVESSLSGRGAGPLVPPVLGLEGTHDDVTTLPAADPHRVVDGEHKDLAVADLACPGRATDGVDHSVDEGIADHRLHLHLALQGDVGPGPAIRLGVAALRPAAHHLLHDVTRSALGVGSGVDTSDPIN